MRFQSGYVAKALRDDGAPLPAAVVCQASGSIDVGQCRHRISGEDLPLVPIKRREVSQP